jgi:hypothetical protein
LRRRLGGPQAVLLGCSIIIIIIIIIIIPLMSATGHDP